MTEERLKEFYEDFYLHYYLCPDYEKKEIAKFLTETINKLFIEAKALDDRANELINEFKEYDEVKNYFHSKEEYNTYIDIYTNSVEKNENSVKQNNKELMDKLKNSASKKPMLFRIIYNFKDLDFAYNPNKRLDFMTRDAFEQEDGSTEKIDTVISIIEYSYYLLINSRTDFFKEIKDRIEEEFETNDDIDSDNENHICQA